MRRVIPGLAVSLDGFIEDLEKGYDWCFCDQDYGMTAFMKEIDTLFIGRKTFERIGGNPFPHKKCYVFSNTLAAPLNGAELINGDIVKRVTTIKKTHGKDIWLFGGAGLTNCLLKGQLIDVLKLSIHPVLLGNGKPLFEQSNRGVDLELLHSKTYSTGLVSLSYHLKNKLQTFV